MEFYENKQEPEKAVLIAIDTGDYDCESSLDELEELAKTAGAEVVSRLWQKRDKPDSATFLGSGRLEELAEFCENNELDLVIADSELSPAQLRNIEKATKIKGFSAIYNRLSELEKDLAFAEIAGDNDKLLELEQEQQQLKNQQISLLSTIGLTPSDLVPKYNCEKCKDTGFIGSNHCDCF